MKCPITPVEYNVVVRPDEVEEKTAGGLYKPQELVEREQFAETTGELVAASPMAFSFDEWPDDVPKPAIGQRVIFVRHAGTLNDELPGGPFRVMKDKDVLGVLND